MTSSGVDALPSTLVVIPTLNEAANIVAVLDSLLKGLDLDQPVRIAVVDGGSTDATRGIVESYGRTDERVTLLENPKRIQSAAMNIAVELFGADYDVLMRCDAHAEYPLGFVAAVAASLLRHGADSLVIPMDSVGRNCVGRAIAWVSDSLVGSGGVGHRGGQKSGWVKHGHHAAWRMAMYRKVGGYDEGFTHNEDVELDCRIRAYGGRIYLDADIRIIYFTRGTLAGVGRQYRNYAKGRSRNFRRHPSSRELRKLAIPTFILINILAILVSAWLPWTLLVPVAYALLLLTTSVQIAWRERSVCGLFAGPAALVMHSYWAFGFLEGFIIFRERAWQLPDGIAPQ